MGTPTHSLQKISSLLPDIQYQTDCTTSFWQIVLLGEVAQILHLRKYITKHNVEKIAIEKYKKNGLGITFEDTETG
jgi:hypothetical protein